MTVSLLLSLFLVSCTDYMVRLSMCTMRKRERERESRHVYVLSAIFYLNENEEKNRVFLPYFFSKKSFHNGWSSFILFLMLLRFLADIRKPYIFLHCFFSREKAVRVKRKISFFSSSEKKMASSLKREEFITNVRKANSLFQLSWW